MLLTNSNGIKIGERKRTIGKRFSLGSGTLKVVVVVIFAAFTLFYLSQSTQSTTRNYTISDLENQKNKVQSETERLEVEATRLKSLNDIQSNADRLGMENIK
ncbi:hypothetical protein COT77_02455 [Candidatus Berkelbacteria bacterium CG10_big_fil_rev_8_21_14_0_10_41_12]|uniref:Cell division protein FtsL n=1 Tax=Candidatus Berkelbacteria bacterium CG10_big_fil_rev_8_21_14_0_10_41_12 TaxID=1974513 RepID=A0A2M6WWT5_9BACT|nr:MAG: hypothetical protein COT77_02455 [Candidatus Berkelbacteria bacterium CG10_big_fil_rev_8_21_14_0_10_41_12]